MNQFLSKITLLLLLSLTLLSCSNGKDSTVTTNATETVATAEETRVIEHAMGTTEIIGTPQRVVVLTNEGTDIALALGLQPVGAVKSWSGDPYFDYIEDKMEGVPAIGDEFQPSLEQIVALKPDLIIGSKIRQEQLYRKLSAIAPTVFSETIGVTWKDNLKLYAKALNKEQESEAILADWNQRVAELKAQLGENPPTVSLIRFMPATARIYYEQSFPGQIVKEVGLERPKFQQKEGFADEVGLESISKMDADYLFYFTYNEGEKQGDKTENSWVSHPLWDSLEVVQNNQAYEVNDVHWTISGGVLAANKLLDDLKQYIVEE